jgi:hypothetical protein
MALLIRRKVILQNITILNAKKSWKMQSYTKLLKWYKWVIKSLINFLKLVNTYIIKWIFYFSILFSLYILTIKLWWWWFNFIYNNWWIWVIIFLLIVSILIKLTKWLLSLIINLAIMFFLFILATLNF